MLHGHVPTGRKQEDWTLYIKTEKDFELAKGSGVAWVLFKDFPLSWEEAKKRMNEVRNEVTNEVNNEEGSDGK